ncbi:MAG: hypothetical protein JWR21_1029 [Herminiimonas sp.]|nr:hypothetical protein [Herminiimonas sp.]
MARNEAGHSACAFYSRMGNFGTGWNDWRTPDWSRRQESDLYLALRRHSFYPLNYGEVGGEIVAEV